MKFSVLDQAPISRGSTPKETLENSIQLAKLVETLGYTRYWVAEHHNTNGLASSAPEILIARLAAETNKIRIGSGGVLLPQYAPLKVAEMFNMLEALYPNRIDLGIGRSPGGSSTTRLALTDRLKKNLSLFPVQLEELYGFLFNDLASDHEFRTIKASPRIDTHPEMWVLGLSERGAINAANIGAGFTFGHFINPENGQKAIEKYRYKFKPSLNLEKPKVNVCVFVVCAETEKKAGELAISQDKWLLNVKNGGDTKISSSSEINKTSLSKEELDQIKENRKRAIVGTPDGVKKELEELSKKYGGVDEFLIITNIFDFKEKCNSYKLLAKVLS
ncbi:LLM class flavin-dependent oxidoreductase [Aquibacillus rhizosphaerae]|uniref:LLM class flavin-dependent oxidoreductase n=1 Tax=Aquibacillus rhizosphaerae TaxID=3051431 RepID=A0ABT7L4P7_9BACI|nr:LLM class flavin-dependent oxidoreductase [Aquibacillus sp. LR5S19]MDL4839571.1 LLM class flavin-dependent oxidoreductase [Aquibacillus sp. LR5S19]